MEASAGCPASFWRHAHALLATAPVLLLVTTGLLLLLLLPLASLTGAPCLSVASADVRSLRAELLAARAEIADLRANAAQCPTSAELAAEELAAACAEAEELRLTAAAAAAPAKATEAPDPLSAARKEISRLRHAAAARTPSLMIAAVMRLHCAEEPGLSQTLAAALNRIEYARLHGYRLAVSTGQEHPRVNHAWNKLAVLERLMHAHRDVEWFLFTDTDAIIEHPAAPVPLERYGAGVELVLQLRSNFFTKPDLDPVADMNSGVMLMRNTAWVRGLLASLLRLGVDFEDGKGCESSPCARMKQFFNGSFNYHVHDQNGLAYVLRRMSQASRAKVFVEAYDFNAQDLWSHAAPRGNSSFRVAHFNGCGFCAKDGNSPFFSHAVCFAAWDAKWRRWLELLRGVEQQRLRERWDGDAPSLLALPMDPGSGE